MHEEYRRLTDQVRLTYHHLVGLAVDLHGERIDPPGRAVLELLARNGTASVPDMARTRGVSRQHVQVIVNGLLGHGLVDTIPNPAHRRSHLVELTAAGRQCIDETLARERALVESLDGPLDPQSLVAAAEVLEALRSQLVAPEKKP